MNEGQEPASSAPHGSPQVRWTLLRFTLLFGALFGLSTWLMDGDGPLDPVNGAIAELTRLQTAAAGWLLHIVGEEVVILDHSLVGRGFSCDVDTGCNGMAAVALFLAAVLSFPARWGVRLGGLIVLLPLVFAVNIARVAGLYWVGLHEPQWFGLVHVYVGQVLVITLTASLWLVWLSWNSRHPSAS